MKKLIILVSLIVSVFASGILKTQDVYALTGVEAVEKYKKDIVASARKNWGMGKCYSSSVTC